MPNSNKYFSNGFITVVSILLQKSVQWNLSCCMPKHPVLHSEGAAEVKVPFTGVQRRETAIVTLLVQSLGNCSVLYISSDHKMTAEISAAL